MKQLIYFLCALLSFQLVEPTEKDYLHSKKEGEALGKEKNHESRETLKSLFKKKKLPFHEQEILPEEIHSEDYNSELAAYYTDTQKLPPIDVDLQEVTRKDEYPSEDLNLKTLGATSPLEEIGVRKEEPLLFAADHDIQTCIEGATFIRLLHQKRKVEIVPQKTREVIRCQGHKEKKEVFWKEEAEFLLKKWKVINERDFNIKEGECQIKGGGVFSKYIITNSYTHEDGIACSNSALETVLLEKEKEIDHWISDEKCSEPSQSLEENIDCQLLQTQEFCPGLRNIKERSIYRDSWERRLVFSCRPKENSSCQRLRDGGGELISQQCLEENELGDCVTWKKTFDIGRRAETMAYQLSFSEDEIFGLQEFDNTYDQNKDFSKVISIFSALSEIENTSHTNEISSEMTAFSGSPSKCRRSFDSKKAFDCCYHKTEKGRGIFIEGKLGSCSSEEKELFKANEQGKCHRVGHVKNLLTTEHVYCCFPNKLSRIIQEEGRRQLGLEWGCPEAPNCQGLSIDQIQKLDFTSMDFSDYISELHEKIDPKQLAAKLQRIAGAFARSSTDTDAKYRTENTISTQKRKVQG